MGIAAALVFLGGCGGHRPLQIVAATSPVAGRSYTTVGRATGTSCQQKLFTFAITDGGRTYDAFQAALKSQPEADALIDTTADTSVLNILIWSRSCAHVNGEAVKFKRAAS
jgi:hypothetical protein